MSWWMFAAEGAMALGSAAAGHSSTSQQAKAAKKQQKYQNAMAMITGAGAQNNITDNVVAQMRQNADEALEIKKNELKAEGAARVAAATSGVKGGSVDAAMLDISRNAATKQYARSESLRGIFLTEKNQRQQVAQQVVNSQDRSVIGGNNWAAEALGLGSKAISLYKNYDGEIDSWFD